MIVLEVIGFMSLVTLVAFIFAIVGTVLGVLLFKYIMKPLVEWAVNEDRT